MPTQKKIELVEEFSKKFKSSKSIFLADFGRINVADSTKLRRSFRAANVQYYVLKNTLAKRSLDKAGIDGLSEMLKGMTAFVFSEDDAVAPIRVINDYNKQLKKDAPQLVVKGCVFEGRIFNADQADALAKLPNREQLLAQLLGVLKAPMTNLVNVLSGTGRKLVGTLEAVRVIKS
jgi:large subunit ribosomal protein L10